MINEKKKRSNDQEEEATGGWGPDEPAETEVHPTGGKGKINQCLGLSWCELSPCRRLWSSTAHSQSAETKSRIPFST